MLGRMNDVSSILQSIDQGDPRAADQLLPLVYEELRKLAGARLAREPADQSLQPTALVHEAFLRLVDGPSPQGWNSRGHFFAAAANAMQRILVDRARQRHSKKRGGGHRQLDFNRIDVANPEDCAALLDLSDALEQLESVRPKIAMLVKLRFFAGLSTEQAAEALQISARTAHRHWSFARAWLFLELSGESLNE